MLSASLYFFKSPKKKKIKFIKILFINNIINSPNHNIIKKYIPKLKTKHKPHFTIINKKNTAHKKKLTKKIYHNLIKTKTNTITIKNHT